MSKVVAQLLIMGGRVFVNAFINAYQQAARNAARNGGRAAQAADAAGAEAGSSATTSSTKVKVGGIALHEARQVLNLKEDATPKEALERYEYLFRVNEKKTGGSFYLQSKVVRAKECVDYDFTQRGLEPLLPEAPKPSKEDTVKQDDSETKK